MVLHVDGYSYAVAAVTLTELKLSHYFRFSL